MATFRGYEACACHIAWLPVYEAELKRRKQIVNSIDIYQLIGGAPQSGGTHLGGGAYDIHQISNIDVWVAREMGAAAWARPKGWDGKDGIPHQHGILKGCPHNTNGQYQIAALEAGYNGLGLNGHGAKDNGPRDMPIPLRTWQEGIKWAKAQQTPPPPALNRIQQFLKGGPQWDVKLLDDAVKAGRVAKVKKVRDGIDAQMKRLPQKEKGTRIATVVQEYKKTRVIRMGMLNNAVAAGRVATVKSVRDEIRKLIAQLPPK